MFSLGEGPCQLTLATELAAQGQDQIPELLTCSNQFGDTVQALAFIIAELERRCCNILFEMLQ